MRTVLENTSEVVHAWANQTQAFGRNSNESFSFNGRNLYSYQMEIASFRTTPDGSRVVFITRASRSVTTNSHQLKAISASRQYEQVIYNEGCYFKDIESFGIHGNRSGLAYPSHIDPLVVWYQYQSLHQALLESTTIKKFSRTRIDRISAMQQMALKAARLKGMFYLNVPDLRTELTGEEAAEVQAANDRKREAEKVARADALARTKVERQEWLDGTDRHYPEANQLDIVLRLNPSDPDEVQTSRGATVPTKVCRRLWSAFRNRQMPADTSVGLFHLDKVEADGLTIGCHHISAVELERFAKVLGLDET